MSSRTDTRPRRSADRLPGRFYKARDKRAFNEGALGELRAAAHGCHRAGEFEKVLARYITFLARQVDRWEAGYD